MEQTLIKIKDETGTYTIRASKYGCKVVRQFIEIETETDWAEYIYRTKFQNKAIEKALAAFKNREQKG